MRTLHELGGKKARRGRTTIEPWECHANHTFLSERRQKIQSQSRAYLWRLPWRRFPTTDDYDVNQPGSNSRMVRRSRGFELFWTGQRDDGEGRSTITWQEMNKRGTWGTGGMKIFVESQPVTRNVGSMLSQCSSFCDKVSRMISTRFADPFAFSETIYREIRLRKWWLSEGVIGGR